MTILTVQVLYRPRTGPVQELYKIRAGTARDLHRACTGTVQGPHGSARSCAGALVPQVLTCLINSPKYTMVIMVNLK